MEKLIKKVIKTFLVCIVMITSYISAKAQDCEINIKTSKGKPMVFYMIFDQDSVYSTEGIIKIPTDKKTKYDSSYFKVRFTNHLSTKVYKIPEQLRRKELLINLCKSSPFVIPRRSIR